MKEKQLQNIIRKVKKGLRSQVLWLCVLSVTASMLTMSFTNNKLGGTRFMFWNFEETTHQAKFRKKPIFVFIYSPTCLQSQRMDDIFKMPKVAELYNKSFVNDKFDTENIGKRMQAIRWGVKSYPSFVFFSKKGDLIMLESGYKKHDETIAMGLAALGKAAERNAIDNPPVVDSNRPGGEKTKPSKPKVEEEEVPEAEDVE